MFTLPDLPYGYDALQPSMSSETLHLHHDKHHARYFTVTNEILAGKADVGSLEDVIVRAAKDGEKKLYNNAAQAWNHTFFWNSMTPGGSKPSGALAEAIDKKYGSYDKFKEEFTKVAIGTFGSGWAWLVRKADGSLDIVSTSNAATPLTTDSKPLLTLDVWEHAYYIDYRNARPKFVEAFWNIVNWAFAEKNFGA